ncbi:MAG: UDP-N-acetylglucosamine 2-epimerase (non-hydrolyzing) [Anaerolineae bacterium]
MPDERLRVLSVFGTRPEAIKLAPVVRQLEATPSIESRVCVTAQHREMLDQVLALFQITPHYDLDVMRPAQSLAEVTSRVLIGLDDVMREARPDWVLVQGDTTTAMAAALGAFYHGIRVAHVEAGLRTGNKRHPFPEEINRRIVSVVGDLHFAPTEVARHNLLREGIPPQTIVLTGNPVIDALLEVADRSYAWDGGPLAGVPRDRRIVLVTAHRRENFGRPIRDICAALRCLVERYPDVQIVYPVHLNPNIQAPVYELLGKVGGVTLLPPLDYLPLVHLMKAATLVLTDSGGLQEEAPSLGKPVLVMRETTERPEAVDAGTARLVGTNTDRIVAEVSRLLDDTAAFEQMARAVNPYGDGRARFRIVDALVAAA